MKQSMRTLICVAFSFSLLLSASGEDRAEAVAMDIQKLGEAIKNNQLDRVIEMTYPPILEAMGGKEKALAALREFMDSAEAASFKVQGFEVHHPLTFLEGDELDYVIVPFSTVMEVRELTIRASGYQLGVKKKAAADWKFVDGEKLDDEMFDTYFPDFPDRSKLPQVTKELLPSPEKKPAGAGTGN